MWDKKRPAGGGGSVMSARLADRGCSKGMSGSQLAVLVIDAGRVRVGSLKTHRSLNSGGAVQYGGRVHVKW